MHTVFNTQIHVSFTIAFWGTNKPSYLWFNKVFNVRKDFQWTSAFFVDIWKTFNTRFWKVLKGHAQNDQAFIGLRTDEIFSKFEYNIIVEVTTQISSCYNFMLLGIILDPIAVRADFQLPAQSTYFLHSSDYV